MFKIELFYEESHVEPILKQLRAVQIKNPKYNQLTNTLTSIRGQLEAQKGVKAYERF